MKPILIHIKRKTSVPTKRQIVYQTRSDWKIVGKIDYGSSRYLFHAVDGIGPIKTEEQFAHWLYEHFGQGIYLCLAWRKGREGFWNFLKIQCNANGTFQRLPKNPTREQIELRQKQQELRTQKLREPDDVSEAEEIIRDNKEIIELEKYKKSGPHPYLKSARPVFGLHEYEDWKKQEDHDVETIGGFGL